MKHLILMINTLFLICSLFAQDECVVDSTINHIDKNINGLWVMTGHANYDFFSTSKEIPNYRYNVIFNENRKVKINSGNYFEGVYYIPDSNKIIIDLCFGTLAAIDIVMPNGKLLDADFFAYDLRESNNFKEFNDHIDFYNNDKYILTLTPFQNLIAFPQRVNYKQREIQIIKIDGLELQNDYTIVNDRKELGNYNLDYYVDFKTQSLVIIKNQIFNENKSIYKKLEYKLRKRLKNTSYPFTYAQLNFDPVTDKYFLDIFKSYFTGTKYQTRQKGEYIGLILNKVNNDKIEINIEEKL